MNVIACMSATLEKCDRVDRPPMKKVLCIGQDPGGPAHLPARQPFFLQPKKCTLQIFSFFFFHENEAKCHGCRASGIFLGDAEILKKVSLFVCWVGLGGWRSAHVIGGTGMETKEIVCFACVLRFHLLFACSFIHLSFLLLHLLQPCRSQVLRSGPARAPAKPGNHISCIRTHEHTRTHPTTMKTHESKMSRQ